MKEHLLSIFPLQGEAEYARLSCLSLEEETTPCADPFMSTRDDLVILLARCFDAEQGRQMLKDLDAATPVQVSITGEQARSLGFQAPLN